MISPWGEQKQLVKMPKHEVVFDVHTVTWCELYTGKVCHWEATTPKDVSRGVVLSDKVSHMG